jgi:heme a synthase
MRIIAFWLFSLCAMVFVMVVLGGVTRLTHSGLSMVDWKPLVGWLPPMDKLEWEAAFARYRQFPEYKELNATMTLSGFKSIFWLEYLHRLWGRIIGLAFLLPFAVFLFKGWVRGPLVWKLLVAFILGGLQGVLGWYMVKSGLVARPDVSQYRLVAHLGAALVVYGYMFWLGLELLFPARKAPSTARPFSLAASLIAGLVFVTILSGGFVAGLGAGVAYNTFPLMDGQWIPDAIFPYEPLFRNFFEDITTVQFDHRILAEITVLVVLGFYWVARKNTLLSKKGCQSTAILAVAVVLQAALGISTLVLAVPIALAAAHQALGVVVFTCALWAAYEMRRPDKA